MALRLWPNYRRRRTLYTWSNPAPPPPPYSALRSPVTPGFPADMGANSAAVGNMSRLPPRGRTASNAGTYQNAPASYSSQQPAGIRVVYQRGGSVQANQVQNPVPPVTTPAPFYQLNHPAQAQGTRGLPPRGRCISASSLFPGFLGPPVKPLEGPVQARKPLPPRGRIVSNEGFYQFTYINSFDGGTNGVTITTGNSGGTSGRAFDNIGSGTGSVTQFDNTHVAHGPLAAEFATGSTSTVADVIWNQGSIPVPQPQLWFRTYVYLTAYNTLRIVEFISGAGGTEAASVAIDATGHIIGRDSASATLFTFTSAAPLNQWFRIEGYVYGSGTSGILTVSRYDTPNSLTANETRTATSANTAGYLVTVRYGITFVGGANIGPFWLDELGLSNIGPLGPVGAVAYPLQFPVQAEGIRGLPSRGRSQGRAGTFTLITFPAVFYPLNHASTAQLRVLPPRGRNYGRTGTFAQTGSQFYALNHPVQARRPLPLRGTAQGRAGAPVQAPPLATFYSLNRQHSAVIRPLPVRGREFSNAGAFQGTGSRFYPLNRPAAAVIRPLPVRGRASGRTGAYGQLGPQFFSLHHPAAAVTRPLPARGRQFSNQGTFEGLGPPFYSLHHPAQAQGTRGLPPKGRDYSRAGQFAQLGPPVTPLQRPVQARQPLPPRGRAQWRYGTLTVFGFVQAVFYPLNRPTAAVVRPLPARGRTTGRTGTFGQLGPVFRQLNHPAQSRQPLPPKGKAQWRYGTFTAIAPGTATFYPLNHPAASVTRPLPARGRTTSRNGLFQATGPAPVPLHGPVQGKITPDPRGRAFGNDGTFQGTGPAIIPPHGPVKAASRPLPVKGRVQGRAGVFTAGPAAPVYPLGHPAAAVSRPLPGRGRSQGRAGVFQGSGPAVKPLQHPVYAWRTGPRRGVTLTSIRPAPPIPFVQAVAIPLRRPVQTRFIKQPPPKGFIRSNAGATITFVVQFNMGRPFTDWPVDAPFSYWHTGRASGNWQQNSPSADWLAGRAGSQWLAGRPYI